MSLSNGIRLCHADQILIYIMACVCLHNLYIGHDVKINICEYEEDIIEDMELTIETSTSRRQQDALLQYLIKQNRNLSEDF